MKKMHLRGVFLAAAASAAIMTSACSTNGGVPHFSAYEHTEKGNYFWGNAIPSGQYFADQKQVVEPYCDKFAKETNPSAGELGAAMGANHTVAGFIGGAGGMAANGAIVGGPVTAPVAVGAGVYYGLAGGTQAYASGMEAADQQIFAYSKHCIMANSAGYRSVAPSTVKEMGRTGRSPELEAVIAASPVPTATRAAPPPLP